MANTNSTHHGHRFQDLTGLRRGRLLVLREAVQSADGRTQWLCQCDCGNTKTVLAKQLQNGKTKSCGCLAIESRKERSVPEHDLKKRRPSYTIWRNMIQRCIDANAKQYHRYGGRGIKVCERWRHSVDNWITDMGQRPSNKHSIDRIDNDGDYEPSNCRWATVKEQARNRRSNRILEFQGCRMAMAEWAEKLGFSVQTIKSRLNLGWSVEEALTKPLRSA